MKLKFKGKVEVGDECRVDMDEDTNGAILVVEKGKSRDVIREIDETRWGGRVTVGICDDTFTGELFVEMGWGYSEYTPMDTDELRVGDHDLIEILKSYEGKEITLFVSDEPINLLA